MKHKVPRDHAAVTQEPRPPRTGEGSSSEALLELFLSLNNVPKDSAVWKNATAGLGVGTVKVRKCDDKSYDELRKIPAVIGIDIKTLK